MKKAFILWALSLLLAGAACSRLEIENIDPDSGSTSGGSETTLTDPELAWSKAACEATIGAENTFPTLSNPYGVEVSYSSSDTSVATIDEKGNITLVAAGSTSIKASSAATDTYAADSDSYALTVLKAGDAITWSATAPCGSLPNFFCISFHSSMVVGNASNSTVTFLSPSHLVWLILLLIFLLPVALIETPTAKMATKATFNPVVIVVFIIKKRVMLLL